jgi:hypothetical protein
MREERQNVTGTCAPRIDPNNEDVLIDARRKNILGDCASPPERDSIAGDVQQDVVALKRGPTKPVGLFVGDERQPATIEPAVENVLASHEGESVSIDEVGFSTALRRGARTDLGGDLGEGDNRPIGIVVDGCPSRHTQARSGRRRWQHPGSRPPPAARATSR